jgi:hypothetical protein
MPYKGGTPRRVPQKILKTGLARAGYLTVALWKGNKGRTHYIHRLVAENFIPRTQITWQVNHKNGNKTDNSISNLEWVSCSGNLLHAVKLGLKTHAYKHGGKHPVVRTGNGTTQKAYKSIAEAVRDTGIKVTSIVQCCQANKFSPSPTYTSGGFVWRYIEDIK